MNFIKKYWFNLFIALIIVISMVFTLLIAFSPKADKLERGFIPCTKLLAENVTNCHGKLWCTFKAITKNSVCDAKVIYQGISQWIEGKQDYPWSNYYFTPDLSHLQTTLDENSELFYQENPNYIQDFEELQKEHKKLEGQLNHDNAEK